MSQFQLARTLSLRTRNFEELAESAVGWDQEYYQMAPGRFEGRIDLLQIGSSQVYRETWGRKIRYRGTAPPGAYGFALPLSQRGKSRWIGRPAFSNTVVLQAPDREADLVSADYWDALVLAIPEAEMVSVVSGFSDRVCISRDLHGVVTLQQGVADKLRAVGLDLLHQSTSASSVDDVQTACLTEQFAQLFLWELVSALDGSDYTIAPTKSTELVRQATDLVLSDPKRRMGLTDICAYLNVSLRRLHYSFQAATEDSPAIWLRRVRLNQVHKILLASSPDDVLVKQVAIDHGFLHLGHFAMQYRILFGCSPSQTLGSR